MEDKNMKNKMYEGEIDARLEKTIGEYTIIVTQKLILRKMGYTKNESEQPKNKVIVSR
jgi:hypothetical protein